MKAMLRRSVGSLVASAALLLAPVALAEGEPCLNDIDCPGGGAACGGDVCNWNKMSATPSGSKVYYCQPAGMASKGSDGWCTADSDCKCAAQGANCSRPPYCTFTKASDAPSAGGSGGAAGGAGGSATGGSATGGSSGAGTAGAATAGAATAGTGTTPAPAEDSGCSVSAPGASANGAALALGLLGLGAIFSRRRRA